VDAVPVSLLRGVAAELEVLPDAVFGRGCAAFAVHDRVLREAAFDGDLLRSRALHDATCTSGDSQASVKPTRTSSCVVVALFVEKHARGVTKRAPEGGAERALVRVQVITGIGSRRRTWMA